jgi:cytochrome c-type biogenesis protein CcmH/NrfG
MLTKLTPNSVGVRVSTDPADHRAFYLLGCSYTTQKEYKKAYRVLEHAVELVSVVCHLCGTE